MCSEAGEERVLAENRVHRQLDFRLRFLNRFWNVDVKQLKEPYLQPLQEETSIHTFKSIVGSQVMRSFVCGKKVKIYRKRNIHSSGNKQKNPLS